LSEQRLEESIKKLQEAKDQAEQKMKEVSLESQQVISPSTTQSHLSCSLIFITSLLGH
jgi:hypothetical protein